jgi:hypothetical protein
LLMLTQAFMSWVPTMKFMKVKNGRTLMEATMISAIAPNMCNPASTEAPSVLLMLMTNGAVLVTVVHKASVFNQPPTSQLMALP